ncbi:MAG: hypothetical protein GC205_09630 [Bacteroidetes bacterium]|nr:hypothetical protein [Bacteroidota bacterium]
MRPLSLMAWITLAFSVSCSSCKKETPTNDEPLPDLALQFTVSGDVSQSIDVLLPENVSAAGQGFMNGSLNGKVKILSLLAQQSPDWMLGFNFFETTELEVGTYTINLANSDIGSYSHATLAPGGFLATSGSVTFSKVELFQSLGSSIGGADDYFVDGSFTMNMEDNSTPPQQITIAGNFSGINIKTN